MLVDGCLSPETVVGTLLALTFGCFCTNITSNKGPRADKHCWYGIVAADTYSFDFQPSLTLQNSFGTQAPGPATRSGLERTTRTEGSGSYYTFWILLNIINNHNITQYYSIYWYYSILHAKVILDISPEVILDIPEVFLDITQHSWYYSMSLILQYYY